MKSRKFRRTVAGNKKNSNRATDADKKQNEQCPVLIPYYDHLTGECVVVDGRTALNQSEICLMEKQNEANVSMIVIRDEGYYTGLEMLVFCALEDGYCVALNAHQIFLPEELAVWASEASERGATKVYISRYQPVIDDWCQLAGVSSKIANGVVAFMDSNDDVIAFSAF